jgi:citrate synthase
MEGPNHRLSVLASHVAAPHVSNASPLELNATLASPEVRPASGGGKGQLTVTDHRTGRSYEIQVNEDGAVKANDLKKIKAGGDGNGLKLYDPGYLNTAPVISCISYIDGDKGILRYRGIPIEELAEKSTHLETAYLLLYGNLPSKAQLEDWESTIMQHSAVPEGVLKVIHCLPHDGHPMGVLVGAICALSSFHPDANPALQGQDLYKDRAIRDKQIVRIIGKVPTIAAAAYLHMAGRSPVAPSSQLSYAENFLYMLDSMGDRSYRPHPRLARALDILFVLHAEHEMNCSTAAVRHLASRWA